jgi:hypothetical protein
MRKRPLLITILIFCAMAHATAAKPDGASKPAKTAGDGGQLFTQEGIDPTFAEVLSSGKLAQGASSNGA